MKIKNDFNIREYGFCYAIFCGNELFVCVNSKKTALRIVELINKDYKKFEQLRKNIDVER